MDIFKEFLMQKQIERERERYVKELFESKYWKGRYLLVQRTLDNFFKTHLDLKEEQKEEQKSIIKGIIKSLQEQYVYEE